MKRIDLDLNTLGSPSDTDLIGSFEEDKKKDETMLPQLWERSPIQKDHKTPGVFFEPISLAGMEESKKSFHVNLIQKIK